MDIEEFPYCCAGLVICDFPYPLKCTDKAELKEIRKEIKDSISFIGGHKTKFLMATLDQLQYDMYGDLLIKNRFKLIEKLMGNHKENIYIFFKRYRKGS